MYMCHNCVAIATRTAKWFNLTNHLLIHNSNYDTVRMLLDSNKVSARITVFLCTRNLVTELICSYLFSFSFSLSLCFY
jgi:hypothetical protein